MVELENYGNLKSWWKQRNAKHHRIYRVVLNLCVNGLYHKYKSTLNWKTATVNDREKEWVLPFDKNNYEYDDESKQKRRLDRREQHGDTIFRCWKV